MAQSGSFEDMARMYDNLTAPQPVAVEHDTLLDSLASMHKIGTAAVRSAELGAVRFANVMTKRYAGALSLNEQGLVRPPLSEAEVSDITTKVDTLSILTQANGEAGALQDKPTDTKGRGFKTSGRK